MYTPRQMWFPNSIYETEQIPVRLVFRACRSVKTIMSFTIIHFYKSIREKGGNLGDFSVIFSKILSFRRVYQTRLLFVRKSVIIEYFSTIEVVAATFSLLWSL